MPKKAPRAQARRAAGGRSPTSGRAKRKSARQRGYTWAWEKAAKQYLAEHPLCEPCLAKGEEHFAEVVDHKIPHRGNMKLFWDPTNWQAMAKRCHDAKRGEEKGRR